jgi:hypothetical protein
MPSGAGDVTPFLSEITRAGLLFVTSVQQFMSNAHPQPAMGRFPGAVECAAGSRRNRSEEQP